MLLRGHQPNFVEGDLGGKASERPKPRWLPRRTHASSILRAAVAYPGSLKFDFSPLDQIADHRDHTEELPPADPGYLPKVRPPRAAASSPQRASASGPVPGRRARPIESLSAHGGSAGCKSPLVRSPIPGTRRSPESDWGRMRRFPSSVLSCMMMKAASPFCLLWCGAIRADIHFGVSPKCLQICRCRQVFDSTNPRISW